MKLLGEGAMSCIELSHCGRYIAIGGKGKIAFIESFSMKHFWMFDEMKGKDSEKGEDEVEFIRPGSAFCYFRTKNKGWSAITL